MVTPHYSDAENLHYVYDWRQEQERTLRAAKGIGMTEEQINHFVDGCRWIYSGSNARSNQHFLDYPSYELFVNPLRDGIFKSTQASEPDWKGRQLRLIVDMDRKVQEAILI